MVKYRRISKCHPAVLIFCAVHFVLDSGEEIFCSLAVKRIVYSGGVDVQDFLIEAAFSCTNFLNFRNQVVKIIFIKI